MAIFSHYGTGQRIGFLIVCFGLVFCFIGSIAPYWMTAKTSIKGDNGLNNVIDDIGLGDVTLFELKIGVWYYCADYQFEEKCYSLYDTSDYKGPDKDEDRFEWINVVRFGVFMNVLLSFLSGLIACCRCLCCSGGRTICHGVLSFFAGAFGFFASVVFVTNTKSLLNVPIIDTEYDWAAWLFTIGSLLLIIASFVLCCALPRETGYGLVVAAPSPGISVNVSNTNTNVSQYNAGGPVQSFEPLPHVAMPPPPPHGFQQQQQPVMGNNPPPYNYNQPNPGPYNYNQLGVMPPADHTSTK